ncbi:ABC transporter ATP-binding protein/permease [Deinococcus radiotolerans]|uniref:ABC transporter CydDC cysteine exporter (CydDC-E) family permease/ATP-binding protein CydD n=1 Tax=Deinococcus radiotolerans TaxID=1309407 RepID=A0ABQ2FK42_9DEIO|nr:ATP-binding cassette domain-containing protein [Deinococcus radiotolerans]GGL00119.1 hypothetical protein GCM10010844_18160 [Deinococcus radiotolerans]
MTVSTPSRLNRPRPPAPPGRAEVRGVLNAPPGVRGPLVWSAALSLLGALGTALAFVLAAQVIAGVLTPPARWPEPGHVLGLALGLGLRAVTGAAREALAQRLATHATAFQRDRLTARLLALGPVALASRRAADLVTLSSELGPRLTPYYARFLPGRAHAAISALVALAVTAWLDPATAGLLLVTGPLTVVFLYLVGLATHAATQAQWTRHTRLAARLLTLTRHLPTLHAFGAVPTYRDVLVRSAGAHREATLRVLRVAFLSGFVMEFGATLATALVAVWIGVRLFGGEATLAPTLAALMLVPEFFGPLRQLGADRHAALDAEPLARDLADLAAVPGAPQGARDISKGAPEVTFTQARAALPGITATLSGTVRSGEHVALRGPSGVGKSALLHALGKFVAHAGEVRVNGVPLDELSAPAWAGQVALVPQAPRLLAASVRDNLRVAAPDADDAALWPVLRHVDLEGVIRALPGTLDAPLGEGGTRLSGGETARLALARALLSGADLLLLDEVTAHLDEDTARALHALIGRAAPGRTVLLVTHRDPPTGWRSLTLEAP